MRRLITDSGCCNIAYPKTPLKTNCLLLVCLGRVARGVRYEAISGSIPVSDWSVMQYILSVLQCVCGSTSNLCWHAAHFLNNARIMYDRSCLGKTPEYKSVLLVENTLI